MVHRRRIVAARAGASVALAASLSVAAAVGAPAQSTEIATETAPATAATVPPPVKVPRRTGTLTDAAGLINVRNENAIISALSDAKLHAGARVEVLVVRSLAEVNAETLGLDGFAQLAFERWNLGDVVRHDGALMVVVAQPPAAKVVTGPYYGGAHDAELATLADETLVPAVRRREYSRGITTAVAAIGRMLSLPVAPTTVPTTEAGATGTTDGSRGVPAWAYGAAGAAVVALGATVIVRRVRRGPPIPCTQCGNLTTRVRKHDVDPDVVVEGGEPIERFLERSAIRLRGCDVCGQQLLLPPAGAIRCGSCTKPMLRVTAKTLRGATSDEPGAVEVEQRCASCSTMDRRVVNVPRLRQGGRVGADHVVTPER